MDPYKQPEAPVTETDANNPVNAQGEEVESTYQTPVDLASPLTPTESVSVEPAPVMNESFTPPDSETTAPLPPEPPVVTSTTPTETVAPVVATAPVAAKSRLWLWLTVAAVLLALVAVLVFVYVL